MPIYTVTCRATPASEPEELFIDALSAGQARGHAAAMGRRVEKVEITPRGRIVGDVIVLGPDHDAVDFSRGGVGNRESQPACGACGYALEGLPLQGRTIRCPECGEESRIAILSPTATVIHSSDWDVSRWDSQSQGPPHPGRAAGTIAAFLAFIGFAHIAPALLAIVLGTFALEQSNRRYGVLGIVVGIIATLLRIIAGLVPS